MRSPILLKFDVWVHYRFAEAAADCLILLKFGRLVHHDKMGGFKWQCSAIMTRIRTHAIVLAVHVHRKLQKVYLAAVGR